MPSSNPAFGRGFAGAGNGQQQYAGWGAAARSRRTARPPSTTRTPPRRRTRRPTTRYMTMDDVVTKTGLSFLVTVAGRRRHLGAARARRPGPSPCPAVLVGASSSAW